jgi:hypothetical protein
MTTPAASFIKFIEFSKLDDSKGKPTVYGIATWEQPDSDNEIADYATAVPVYQAWSEKALRRTKQAGQELSLGNVRVQHGAEVGGKVTKIDFRDDDKEIALGSEPVDDAVYQMLKGGFLTGYSQGGSYAWRKCETCGGNMPLQQGANFCEACDAMVAVRYGLKRLAEVSYVDSPAIGEGFEHVKAGGSCEIIKFQKRQKEAPVAKEKKTKRVAGEDLTADCFAYVGDPEKTETWKLPIKFSTDAKTKRHIRNALARIGQTKGIPADEKEKVKAKIVAAAKDHGIDVDEESGKSVAVRDLIKARIDTAAEGKGLQKGLYAVSRYAELLETLSCLYEQSVWERDIEGDDSDVPEELRDQLDQMIETFIAMAEEEARELAANKNDNPTGATTMTPEELEIQKAAKKSLASHFAKAASHHEKMADKHEAIADEHETAADAHAEMATKSECKCGKADVSDAPEHAAIHDVLADQQEFHKSMQKCEMAKAKQHDGIAALHDKMAEHLTKMAEANDDSQDKADTAAILKAERATADPAPVVKPAPEAPTMEADVAKAAQLQRETPEYKQAIADIAKAAVDAEVAALRDKTLAPIGTVIDDPSGVRKGTVAPVRRGASEDEVELVSSSASRNAGGL